MRKLFVSLSIFSIIVMSGCKKESFSPPDSVNVITVRDFKINPTGVTLEQAEDFAIRFLEKRFFSQSSTSTMVKSAASNGVGESHSVSVKNSLTIEKKGKPYFHLVNTNKGYVLLSADSLFIPVLAYDSVGEFSFNTIELNTGLITWLNRNAIELDYNRNNKSDKLDSIGKKNKVLWKVVASKEGAFAKGPSDSNKIKVASVIARPNVTPPTLISSDPTSYSISSNVGPLLSTLWDQDYPYNQYTPTGSGGATTSGHMPTGCVPTSMAQIMRYWQWPSNYDWTNMPNYSDDKNSATWPVYNPVGYQKVARLMSDIGITSGPIFIGAASGFSTSQFAYYTADNTAADDAYAPWVFGQFGYSSVARTASLWDQTILGSNSGTYFADLLTNEVQNHRPCLIGGYSEQVHPWYLGLSGLLL